VKTAAGKSPEGGSAVSTPERVIEAATELFLRDGYGNTNLDAVAASAGVTKPTVYSHFGSKDGLLIAITRRYADAKATAMSSALVPTGDVRADLTRFGEVVMRRVVGEEANCWHRLAMTESSEHPEIGQAIYDAGPARVLVALTRFLADETEAGRLTCEDASMAAEQFLGLLIGLQPIRMMSGQKPPSNAKRRRIRTAAVNTFLAAFGVKP
jgi:TetR/AcrR family transcriptional repressor of mexJK operon